MGEAIAGGIVLTAAGTAGATGGDRDALTEGRGSCLCQPSQSALCGSPIVRSAVRCPFGSRERSGYGTEIGREAVRECTQLTSVWVETSEDPVGDPFVLR